MYALVIRAKVLPSAPSVTLIASLYVVGSLESVKNNPGEYVSAGRVSLSDRCCKTGLPGAEAGAQCAAKISSTVFAGSY